MRPNIIDMSGLCWKGWGNSTYSSRQKKCEFQGIQRVEGKVEALLFLPRLCQFLLPVYAKLYFHQRSTHLSMKIYRVSVLDSNASLPPNSFIVPSPFFPCRTELILWANKNVLPSSLHWKRSGIGWRGPPSIPGAKCPTQHEACRLNQAWLFTLHHLLHFLNFIEGPRISKRITCHTSTHLTGTRIHSATYYQPQSQLIRPSSLHLNGLH